MAYLPGMSNGLAALLLLCFQAFGAKMNPERVGGGPDHLVVMKPSGILVHNSAWAGPRENTLLDWVRGEFGAEFSPVHRLDRGASGLVVFARTRTHLAHWQTALASPDTQKGYLCAVRGPFVREVLVDHPIRDEKQVAKEARTFFFPLDNRPEHRASLVWAFPKTGRLHQIRRHAKHLSIPLLGDASYGKGKLNRQLCADFGLCRLALHAALLRVVVPGEISPSTYQAPLPSDLLEPLSRIFGDVDQKSGLFLMDKAG
jgi:tRNA pseudouridine65 synthase